MLTLRQEPQIPTLRSIEDAKGSVDLEQVINLGALYALGIDTSNAEHLKRMGVWHPSSVGYCRRSQVLQFIRTAPTDEQSKQLKSIFEVGHAHHDIVESRLAKLGPILKARGLNYEFQREATYDPKTDQLFLEFDIGGTADGTLRIWNKSFEQRGLVEIKSNNDDRHNAVIKMPTAYPNHLLQSHIYAFRFKLPIIWVFYINKNNQKREIKTQLYDEAIFDEALNYFVECSDYVSRGELPAREETWFECSECVYRTMCKPSILRSKRSRETMPLVHIRRRPAAVQLGGNK